MNDAGPQTAPAVVPATANHVGLTTPDMFATIDFYESALGFRLIMGPRILEPQSASAETRSVFGPAFHKAYQAHLLSANGFGIELFQFLEPPVEQPDPGYRYTRPGWSHLCLTVPRGRFGGPARRCGRRRASYRARALRSRSSLGARLLPRPVGHGARADVRLLRGGVRKLATARHATRNPHARPRRYRVHPRRRSVLTAIRQVDLTVLAGQLGAELSARCSSMVPFDQGKQ